MEPAERERERSTPERLGLPFRVGLSEGPFCTMYIRTPTIKMFVMFVI